MAWTWPLRCYIDCLRINRRPCRRESGRAAHANHGGLDAAGGGCRALPALQRKLNVTIKFSFVPRTGYETKLQTQFAGGTTPDIYGAPPEDVEHYANQGQVLDQVPYLKQLGLSYNRVVPQVQFWAGNKPGTKLWGQSAGGQSMYIFYNKDAFKQAGMAAPPSDAAHAWTWPQFVAAAKKLTVDRNGRHPDDKGFDARHIQRYGVNIPDNYLALLPLIQSNGGRDFDPTGKRFTLNQPASVQVIQDVADLVKDHVMPTPSALQNGAGSITLASGRLGMEINGNWNIYFYGYPKATFSWGIGVLPRFKQYRAFYFPGNAYLVTSKTAHPKEAVQFDDCLTYSGLPNYQSGLWVPVQKNLLYGSGIESWLTASYHPANYKSVVVNTIKDGLTPPFDYTPQFGPIWTNTLTPALDQVMAGASAQTVLNNLKPRIDALLTHG